MSRLVIELPQKKSTAQAIIAMLKELNISFVETKTNGTMYSKKFVEKIDRAEEQFKNGDVTTVKHKDNKKFLSQFLK